MSNAEIRSTLLADSKGTLLGANDSTAVESLKSTWKPDLSALEAVDPAAHIPRTGAPPSAVPELEVSPIDLHGGPNSRANKTKRYNEERELERELERSLGKRVLNQVKRARQALLRRPASEDQAINLS